MREMPLTPGVDTRTIFRFQKVLVRSTARLIGSPSVPADTGNLSTSSHSTTRIGREPCRQVDRHRHLWQTGDQVFNAFGRPVGPEQRARRIRRLRTIVFDKTGTLTEGIVHLRSALGVEGTPSEKVLLYAYLNAFYETGFTNPIDEAIRRHRQFPEIGHPS